MSHRWNCPDKYEAEREGERAYEYGRSRSSNPHESMWGRDEGCPEAADAWRDGYRRAEIREEERREEDVMHRRAEARRAYELEEEASYYEAQREAEERAYYEEQQAAAYAEELAQQQDVPAPPEAEDGTQ